ncbi:MAG: hypothetical protein AAF517_12735, partial [Planctomycetota bacterium]
FGGESWEASDKNVKVSSTRDGGFAIVSSTESRALLPPRTHLGIYLSRIDSNGETLWERTYAVSGEEALGHDVRKLGDGDFAVAGERDGAVWLLRTSNEGDLVWDTTLEATSSRGRTPLVTTSNEGIVVGNRITSSDGRTGTDAYFVGVDSTGEPTWRRRIGDSGSHRVLSMVQREGGIVALCAGPNRKPYLVKLAATDEMSLVSGTQ